MARDAYVSWQGSRYSVPWQYAGKEVWVREHGGDVEVRHGGKRIADALPARADDIRSSLIARITRAFHSGARGGGKMLDSDSAERADGGSASFGRL